jgi:hypothetical protein
MLMDIPRDETDGGMERQVRLSPFRPSPITYTYTHVQNHESRDTDFFTNGRRRILHSDTMLDLFLPFQYIQQVPSIFYEQFTVNK